MTPVQFESYVQSIGCDIEAREHWLSTTEAPMRPEWAPAYRRDKRLESRGVVIDTN